MLYIMVFTVSYYIIQTSTDDTILIVPPATAGNVWLTCSLNVIIPADMTVTWSYNGDVIFTVTIRAATTNIVRLRERSQAGVYQCAFNYTTGYSVRRNITVIGMCNNYM